MDSTLSIIILIGGLFLLGGLFLFIISKNFEKIKEILQDILASINDPIIRREG